MGATSPHWAAAVAGATAGGVAVGLLDAGLLLARGAAALGTGDVSRVLLAGAAAGSLGGLLLGLLLSVGLRVARRWRRARTLGAVAGINAVAAAVVDATVLVGLYPYFHAGLALLTLGAAVCAGALLWPSRHARPAALVAALLAAAAPWALDAATGEGRRLRQLIAQHARQTAWAVAWLTEDPAAAPTDAECAWPLPAPAPAGGAARGRSILLVTVDALRGDLGGARLAEVMPRTAQRLSGAARFDRAYAAAPRTAESVYALLTGRHVHALRFDAVGIDAADRVLRVRDEARAHDPRTWKQRHPAPVRDQSPTLPALLRPAGLRSLAVVPYVFFLPQAGITREFDLVDATAYQEHNRDNQGVTSEPLTDRALEQIRAQTGPFFLWVHYMDPHAPYVAYGDLAPDAPEEARYRSELLRVDAALERLFSGLEADGQLSGLVVVLTADHGEEFRDHGGQYHGTSVYEEQIHVPLYVRAPGLGAVVVDTPVSLIDLAPTLVDLAGVESPAVFDGVSRVPALRGEPTPARPILARASLFGTRLGLIDGHDKLIVDLERQTASLYDLRRDPGERADRVDEAPETLARLACLLHASGALTPAGAHEAGAPGEGGDP